MKNANSHDKPSPSDTPTKRPNDNGHKSIVDDTANNADELFNRNIANRRENEEQPVHSVKKVPKE